MVFMSGNPIRLMIQGQGVVFSADQVNVLIEPHNSDRAGMCQCTITNIFPNEVCSYAVVIILSNLCIIMDYLADLNL